MWRFALLLRTAWRSLYRNKVRTLLTMLGIVIGVAAVIAMVALGHGAQIHMEQELLSIGQNLISVQSKPVMINGVQKGERATLTPEDVDHLKAACPSVRYVNASVYTGDSQVVFQDQNASVPIQGVSAEYQVMHHVRLAIGQSVSDDDVRYANRICILGAKTADTLFGNRDPLGQVVRIHNLPFKVVGVNAFIGGTGWFSTDDKRVYLPYTTVMRDFNHTRHLYSIEVCAWRPDQMQAAQDELAVYLRQRHHIHGDRADDFHVEDIQAMLDEWRQQEHIFAALLGGVASISLLVGGIGIMNIMLVTVTERIKEIGTRMALGARPIDIMLQFFIEALTVSLIGGLLGIALGIGTAHLVDRRWTDAIVTPDSIVIAFVVSCGVGVFFGLYPAVQAARLDPIQALRPD